MVHTPGPYRLFNKNGVVAVLDRRGKAVIHWTGFDASDFPDCIVDNAALFAAAPETAAERDAWRNALMGLTPGGSEYTTPEACVAAVRAVRERQHYSIVSFKLEGDRLKARVTELVGTVAQCAEKAHEYAGHYPIGSDGSNTFILLAEWIEARAKEIG